MLMSIMFIECQYSTTYIVDCLHLTELLEDFYHVCFTDDEKQPTKYVMYPLNWTAYPV